jgi:hypothetical protein
MLGAANLSLRLWMASSEELLYDRPAAVEKLRKYRIGDSLQWAWRWFP